MRITLAATSCACALVLASPPAYAQTAPAARAAVNSPTTTWPAEARIAFVDLSRVASLSKEGRALVSKVEDLRARKQAEIQARSKEVASLESQLTQSSALLNDAARQQLRRQFERANVDFQRFAQDAQTEVTQVQRELERAFMEKATPAIGAVARERSLWAVFSVDEAGLLWREPALDISEEIARRIDGN